MEKNIAYVGLLLAISGVFLAYAGLSEEILSGTPIISKNRNVVYYLGIIFSIISIPIMFMISVVFIKSVYIRIMDTIKGRKKSFSDKFVATRVNKDQLIISYELIKDILLLEGIQEVISFEIFCELWEKNNDVYLLVWDIRKSSQPKPVGFVNAYPINALAAKDLLSGSLRGRDLKAANICGNDEVIPAYYIGAIAASSMQARAAIILVIDKKISELSLDGQFPQIFTVPYTKRGRIIARDYGFRPIRKYSDAELWLRNSPPAIRSHRPNRITDWPQVI